MYWGYIIRLLENLQSLTSITVIYLNVTQDNDRLVDAIKNATTYYRTNAVGTPRIEVHTTPANQEWYKYH